MPTSKAQGVFIGFNDIATFYNTRLSIIPDRFVAGPAGLHPPTPLLSSDFERARWMGRNGRVAVETAFSWDVVANQVLAVYES